MRTKIFCFLLLSLNCLACSRHKSSQHDGGHDCSKHAPAGEDDKDAAPGSSGYNVILM